MQRIIIAYNPRSSKHARIREEVIEPLQKKSGYVIGKFEVKSVPVDENAKELAKILVDDDLLIVAGGDGTATVGINAAMQADAEITLGVLGYGNFNDFARMVNSRNLEQILDSFKQKKVKTLYPLEAIIDGKAWRYAACYFTIGMFAESTEVFDVPKTRKSLKKGRKCLMYSVVQLAKWYFRNRKTEFLAKDIRMNNVPMNRMKVGRSGRMKEIKGKHVSDVLFVNGKTVAKIMKGGKYWQDKQDYYVSYGRLKGFFRLCSFMMRSIFSRMPGHVVTGETKIDFSAASEFEIQAEGEYTKLEASELIVRKSAKGVKVVIS